MGLLLQMLNNVKVFLCLAFFIIANSQGQYSYARPSLYEYLIRSLDRGAAPSPMFDENVGNGYYFPPTNRLALPLSGQQIVNYRLPFPYSIYGNAHQLVKVPGFLFIPSV